MFEKRLVTGYCQRLDCDVTISVHYVSVAFPFPHWNKYYCTCKHSSEFHCDCMKCPVFKGDSNSHED